MMERNNIISIPGGKLTGFLWRSDDNPHTVEVYDGSEEVPEISLDASDNPFVVEGQLYNDSEKKSYSVKYIDGLYWLGVYDVKKMDEDVKKEDIQEYKYIASFDDAPGRLYFKEYWRIIPHTENERICFKEQDDKKKDDLLLDFEALCPAEFVFVGFVK